jgi:hypothetical protein
MAKGRQTTSGDEHQDAERGSVPMPDLIVGYREACGADFRTIS